MQRLVFDPFVIHSVVGGKSALDIPRLNIENLEEAENFIKGYGFDLSKEEELERLWYFHRRALVLIEERLGFQKAEIPEILRDPKALADLRNLLLWASEKKPEDPQLQKWSCAILRVMHVFVHSENDLFSTFSEEIQKQILTPFQDCIFHEGTTGTTYLKGADGGAGDRSKLEVYPLPLVGFEVKPFKTSTSTVIKLLAKPNALAMSVFDKLGLRFVTKSMFDTFRVIRFLVEENLISFPHIMPEQSSNNLYPVDLFLKVSERIGKTALNLTPEQITGLFEKALAENPTDEGFFRKDNHFSGEDLRFIKFISRKLIKVKTPGGSFSFFYPFEIQIMDQASHERILSGPSEHQAYKDRQVEAARKRILAK